jgi:G3E family GTPase
VPHEILLGVGRFDPARADLNGRADEHGCTAPDCHHASHGHDHNGHDHAKVFSTWSYETDRPPELGALREAMHKLPGTIYRAKGVIYSTDAPQRRAVL